MNPNKTGFFYVHIFFIPLDFFKIGVKNTVNKVVNIFLDILQTIL
jgi:hypothetical protein